MQPEWMSRVRVGSIVQERGGAWRVVRKVTRKPNGDLWGVTLTIRHCSWTTRCYTVLIAADLKTRGFRLVGQLKREPDSEFDRKVLAAINQRDDGGDRSKYVLRCCDVEGIA